MSSGTAAGAVEVTGIHSRRTGRPSAAGNWPTGSKARPQWQRTHVAPHVSGDSDDSDSVSEQGSGTSSSKKPELLPTRSATRSGRPNRLTSVRYTTDGWFGPGVGDTHRPWVANPAHFGMTFALTCSHARFFPAVVVSIAVDDCRSLCVGSRVRSADSARSACGASSACDLGNFGRLASSRGR
jgi:hypothetical protein